MLALLCLSLVSGAMSQHCNIMCAANYKPVCGSDGRTYSNSCQLAVAACHARRLGRTIYLANNGRCGSTVQMSGCDQICDEEKQPICASDGKVYENKCRFTLAQCEHAKNGTSLIILKYGDVCPTPREPNCEKYKVDTSDLAIEMPTNGNVMMSCPHGHHYVCASTGASFSNECQLCHYISTQEARYESMQQPAPEITILYDGVCHSVGHIRPGLPINVL
ncbi:extracellular protease inhibitor 10-like [Gigantopelta aegis]|uniref:extracellular protease inhibitor 10-like n=1 Tax=Gigantopelta aegis TaxID=1735272 RepID=UPI001B88B0D3|nr:extracellular protease inhibitor 10-like [Gigantopelta aegis]